MAKNWWWSSRGPSLLDATIALPQADGGDEMKSLCFRTSAVVLLGSIGAGLVLLGVEQWCRPEEDYSLIEQGLYLGGRVSRPPTGTKAVLNLCRTADPYQTDTSRWEPIPDAEPVPSIAWLREMVGFVEDNRKAGRTVYVHCGIGVSRSGLVVTAYEMSKNGWSRDKALEFVRTRRPVVQPNPAFMQLLLEWEEVLKKQSGDGRIGLDAGSWCGCSSRLRAGDRGRRTRT